MDIRSHFHNELKELFEEVINMGEMVTDAMRKGLQSLISENKTSALEVIDDDQKIDNLQLFIEDRCTLLIAKESPVATELREILTVLKIVSELERMGDHARHMAQRTGEVSKEGLKIARPYLEDMTESGCQMVKEALESFIEQDSKWAEEIASRDNYIDSKYYDLYDKLIKIIKAKPNKTENLVPLLFLNRILERMGDRVTNICECIVYTRTNKHVDLN